MDTLILAAVFAASAAVSCGVALALATLAALHVYESLKSAVAAARPGERHAGAVRF